MRISEINSVIKSPQGIYQIRNIESGKIYVGSAVSLRKRWNRHRLLLERGTHDNVHLQRAWNIHGPGSFEFSVLEYIDDAECLIKREQFWLDKLDALKCGYNLLPVAGSRLGSKMSAETKRKISEKLKGRLISEETRKRISAASSGRVMPESAKRKLSEIASRRKMSKETIEKIRASVLAKNLAKARVSS